MAKNIGNLLLPLILQVYQVILLLHMLSSETLVVTPSKMTPLLASNWYCQQRTSVLLPMWQLGLSHSVGSGFQECSKQWSSTLHISWSPFCEVTWHHFHHIALVKGSHGSDADSRDGEKHSTSGWGGWQKKKWSTLSSPATTRNTTSKACKSCHHCYSCPILFGPRTQHFMLTVLMFSLKLPSPIASNSNIILFTAPSSSHLGPQVCPRAMGQGIK